MKTKMVIVEITDDKELSNVIIAIMQLRGVEKCTMTINSKNG